MKIEVVDKFLSSGLNPEYDRVTTIEVADKFLGEGASGSVYPCISINGKKPAIPQAIKFLTEDKYGNHRKGFNTIQKLQERIKERRRNRAKKEKAIEEIPALFALPQFSFSGKLNGKDCLVYSANMLSQDYLEFEDIIDRSESLRKRYNRLRLDQKLKFMLHLAEGFNILRDISFIHADINPKNLFINIDKGDLVIIDYDGGAVTQDASEKPTTWGKRNDWVAPQIIEQLSQEQHVQTSVKVDLFTDTWSVAVGMFYLLFLCGPFFFLKRTFPKAMEEYFRDYKWPAIDEHHNNFNTQTKAVHSYIIENLNKKELAQIKTYFETTFNAGFDRGSSRTSYYQWFLVIKEPIEQLEPIGPIEPIALPPQTRLAVNKTIFNFPNVPRKPPGRIRKLLVLARRRWKLLILAFVGGWILISILVSSLLPDKKTDRHPKEVNGRRPSAHAKIPPTVPRIDSPKPNPQNPPSTPPTVTPPVVESGDYFPIQKGARWKYELKVSFSKKPSFGTEYAKANLQSSVECKEGVIFHGREAIVFEEKRQGNITIKRYYQKEKDAILYLGYEYISENDLTNLPPERYLRRDGPHGLVVAEATKQWHIFEPPIVQFHQPIMLYHKRDIASLHKQNAGKEEYVTGSTVIEGKEKVQVQAGLFEALKLVSSTNLGEVIAWYAKEIGLVKKIEILELSAGKQTTTYELVSYSGIPSTTPRTGSPKTTPQNFPGTPPTVTPPSDNYAMGPHGPYWTTSPNTPRGKAQEPETVERPEGGRWEYIKKKRWVDTGNWERVWIPERIEGNRRIEGHYERKLVPGGQWEEYMEKVWIPQAGMERRLIDGRWYKKQFIEDPPGSGRHKEVWSSE